MLDDLDREAWFKLLVEVEARFGWKIHVWNLLDNHFHLLVETTQPELSRGMQRLNGLHAMRFNRRYDRRGHLFQGRFESRVITDERYLEHRDPLHLRQLDPSRAPRLALARSVAAPIRMTMLAPGTRMGDESRLSEHPVGGIERLNGAVVVRLIGELDLYNAPQVRAALLEVCAEQPERLVVDLREVDFVDSTALGVLIEARTKLENRQSFLLASPGLETHRALTISGLDQHLSVHDTVESALAASVRA